MREADVLAHGFGGIISQPGAEEAYRGEAADVDVRAAAALRFHAA